ncbi:MAG: hypothetical protein FWD77_01660 [Betaproteobacteria bacterium]|nr:hypothetical protein [Betaproteobacteria bacterium]
MAIKTRIGRAADAEAIRGCTWFFAWGRGDPAWDALAPEPRREDFSTFEEWRSACRAWRDTCAIAAERPDATGLIDEIGRRLISPPEFVTPDEAGDILIGDMAFSRSAQKTNYLLARCTFSPGEGVGEKIREVGIFVNGLVDPGCPPGQRYFLPHEIVAPGDLYLLENGNSFDRHPSKQEAFEWVITL